MLLRSGGMSAPDSFAGEVTKVLADAGLFRLRALLVGSVAFSCYSGLLGVRLPGISMPLAGHMRLPFHCRKSSEGILLIAETNESRHHSGILFHHGSENAATFLENLFCF